MNNRPALDEKLDAKNFRDYYLKEELANFCRKHYLQAAGSKAKLTNRITRPLKPARKLVKLMPVRNLKLPKQLL